jgi:hypothetical protein
MTGGSGPGGGDGGAATSGGNAGGAGAASCDAEPCPDLGTCTAEQQAAGCVRTCSFNNTYALKSNDDVASLAALKCTIINGSVDVAGSVASLGGLETVREITGTVRVLTSNSLANLDGLSGLEKLGDLTAQGVGLTSLHLPALREASGYLDLEVLAKLTSLELPSLETVGAQLTVTVCPLLPSLHFDKLESVGQLLNVSGDSVLTTVNGFPSLKSVGRLQFTNDAKLPQCEIDAIASRLAVTCKCSGNDSAATCN